MERCFIRELVRKFESGSSKARQPSDEAIHSAVAAVNIIFSTKLTFNIGQARLNHLKERHETFSWLISRLGEMPSAQAYRFDTESAWDELKIIFGVPEMSHSTQ
ncbi:hypothetical protein Salat_2509300 [Sesamum alatum]|uniref:Uncharacterized protein n=1 Tax=Sesamum alatum TaxID=300844 RepID=A0AAE2CC75_9LAMI|nr:hypothetical protein Salat_2509300 [Sesamum alatum]